VVAGLIGLLAAIAPARAQNELLVLNEQRTVTVYPRGASGDSAPVRSWSVVGPGAALAGIAVDTAHGELFVTDSTDDSISIYPIGASFAPAPIRVIRGPATGLAKPSQLAYDAAHDQIIVLNGDTPSITVYDRGATGDAPPLRVIAGASTGLVRPVALALDSIHDELIVSDAGQAVVNVYARTATGDVAPVRVLAADPAGLVVDGVAVDPAHGELMVIRGAARELAVFPREATGAAPPLRVLVPTTPEGFSNVLLDAVADELILLDPGSGFAAQPAVLAYARTASGAAAPLRTLAGFSTGLVEPRALALSGAPPPATTLAASVLPSSRSVAVGQTAGAFVTIINTGSTAAFSVGIAPEPFGPATITYHTTSCASNALVGAPNQPVDIAAGEAACYAIFVTPSAVFDPLDVTFSFGGTNTLPVPVIHGVNTFLLSGAAGPTPDVVALVATAGANGIVDVPGIGATGAFAVAVSNVGISGTVALTTETGDALPIDVSLCETDAAGQCLAWPSSSVVTAIAGQLDAGTAGTSTYAAFVTASSGFAFDPAVTRLFLRWRDAGGITRGGTSVAVRIP